MNSKDMIHHDNAPQDTDPVADARVTDALNLLGTVEPPSELIAQVMWRTKHQSVQNNSRRPVARRNEGMHMAKKVLIGLIGIAAAGLLVAYISGGIPATTGTEGTIGAAQRYNAEQIKKSDVTIENAALASFMQTDIFEKLSRDKMAVAALASPDVQAALGNAQIAAALADSTLAQALVNADVQAALANPALAQALASPELQKALVDAAANGTGLQVSGLDSQLASALANPALAQALANKDFAAALAAPGLQAALANPALAQAMLNKDFAAALASPGLQGALASPGLGQILADSTAAQLLGAQLQNAQASALGASGFAGHRE